MEIGSSAVQKFVPSSRAAREDHPMDHSPNTTGLTHFFLTRVFTPPPTLMLVVIDQGLQLVRIMSQMTKRLNGIEQWLCWPATLATISRSLLKHEYLLYSRT